MGGGGGGNDTTTVQKADPWSGQQPYLSYGFQQAQNLYNSGGPQYYPNATYTPFSAQSNLALELMQNRALAGSPVSQAAQDQALSTIQGNYVPSSDNITTQLNTLASGGGVSGDALSATARGDFLNSNPYLDQTYNRAADAMTRTFNNQVMPSVNATFSSAGRTGSGAQMAAISDAQRNLGDSLGGLATDIYGGNYAQERQNQLSAAGQLGQQQLGASGTLGGMINNERGRQIQSMLLSPQLAAADYADLDRLYGVGQAVEGKAGEMLADTMGRYNYYQNLPEQNLAKYISAIQGNYGSATTSTTDVGTPQRNKTAGAMGGAATGATVGSYFGPWGTAIGAIGGGLLGAFA